MARGLRLAQVRGVGSLEELIELLLHEAVLSDAPAQALRVPSPTAGGPTFMPAAPSARVSEGTATKSQSVSKQHVVVINSPAISLSPPADGLSLQLAPPAPDSPLPLPFLTNRLSPLKASVRALANLAVREREWPKLSDFQAKAGHAARDRGLQLQAEDHAAGRRARQKRSVAWPIGANPIAALERFIFAFTLATDNGTPTGPLASLGLATLVEGRAALTRHGWKLATAPSPVLDGGEGTLSVEEIAILRERLVDSSAERDAVVEFVRAAHRAAGAQPRIDELLSAWHSEWSADQAAAQRSAMIGRLGELGLIEVTGRGVNALVALGDVEQFERESSERSAA